MVENLTMHITFYSDFVLDIPAPQDIKRILRSTIQKSKTFSRTKIKKVTNSLLRQVSYSMATHEMTPPPPAGRYCCIIFHDIRIC